MNRVLAGILIISNLLLAAFVAFQCMWGGAGLGAYSDGKPDGEAIYQELWLYSGNRFETIIKVVPAALVIQAILCVVLAFRCRTREPLKK